MKETKSFVLTMAILVIGFHACEKDKSIPDPSNSSTSEIVGLGTWRITLYNDSGNEETQNFAGYNFTFNINGTIAAVKNTSTVNGTWNTGVDDSQNKHVSGGNGGTDLLTFEKN